MNQSNACNNQAPSNDNAGFELARIPRTKAECALCEEYAERHSSKPVAVISCEGTCLRGEIARQAANLVCHSLTWPEK